MPTSVANGLVGVMLPRAISVPFPAVVAQVGRFTNPRVNVVISLLLPVVARSQVEVVMIGAGA